jgi:ectoine hydroxylase-related dioxygenase (phytanoyl-CoA dioxygenase family)
MQFTRIGTDKMDQFERDGFVQVNELLLPSEVEYYSSLYNQFLSGEIDCKGTRLDLGAGEKQQKKGVENITTILWPSNYVTELTGSPAYQRALSIAQQLLGKDMAFDFDMLIDKAPESATITPWHQDASYWIDLPDKRAVSCWLALDEATLDNGCMWFAPGSHLKLLRPHRSAGKGGGALECDGTESEAIATPLKPGCCTFHAGGTLHYSRGNFTAQHRRALITNFRPEAMIRFEREKGFDHGKTKKVIQNRNIGTQTQDLSSKSTTSGFAGGR